MARMLATLTVGLGVFATAALSAPTPSKPPSISGKPNFDSVLTCNQGTWSADAVSFDYAWTYSGGGPTFGTGRKLDVPQTVLDYAIVCVVTAHDAQGQTTSATSNAVTIGPGVSSVRITKATVKKGRVTFSGVASPGPALARSKSGSPAVVLDRRLTKNTVVQISSLQVVHNRKGKFTVGGHDTRGRHTYILIFIPAASSGFSESKATRRLRVK
jgi:hypothetical protein